MSATRGREVVPQRRMASRPAASSRRTSSAYAASRRANASWAALVIVFCTSRIIFLPEPTRRNMTMAWDFRTDPEYQAQLDWVDTLVREAVEPLDMLFPDLQFHPLDATRRAIIDPLKDEVRRRGLWATHLGPELGGQGFGQLKLALLNEILGRSLWASIVFGCQAPDTGNAEIIAHYGTEEQKEKYLQPLLDGRISSCYSMTEPQAGADPQQFRCRAERDGDEWVVNGEKWFSSNLRYAKFAIVMAITDPEVNAYQGMSMFLVPT